jgi:thiamine-phosphate pyrophosphorylase
VPPPDFDLYLVTDRRQTNGRELSWVIDRALAAGVRAVQLREKDLGGRELLTVAESIKTACARHGAKLFINDRVDVALAVAAEGVQLGAGSMPVGAAREILGAQKLIGASIHSLEEGQDAERAGADFAVFGPVYFTPSKAAYGEPQGLARLKEIVEKISLPVYAIGGVTAENVVAVRKTGARGVALISAIMSAADPAAAAENLLGKLKMGNG